jgi:hypothetical protein
MLFMLTLWVFAIFSSFAETSPDPLAAAFEQAWLNYTRPGKLRSGLPAKITTKIPLSKTASR